MSDAILYTTLEQEGEAEFVEKKSVFIGHAAPVKSEEEAQAFVKRYKNTYMDARHNVWAYLMKGEIVARYSDDGEPQGTAGVPVLDTIRKSGVTDAVVVVTRYFGGILLGAGGLVRAYSHKNFCENLHKTLRRCSSAIVLGILIPPRVEIRFTILYSYLLNLRFLK